MSITVLSQTEQRARKEYRCMCRQFFCEIGIVDMLQIVKTDEEKQYVSAYNERKGRIFKGEIYIRQGNIHDGSKYTFIADKGMFKIFCKYHLWPED